MSDPTTEVPDPADTVEMTALLARAGITPAPEETERLVRHLQTAREQAALVHGVTAARYEDPLLVHRALS